MGHQGTVSYVTRSGVNAHISKKAHDLFIPQIFLRIKKVAKKNIIFTKIIKYNMAIGCKLVAI